MITMTLKWHHRNIYNKSTVLKKIGGCPTWFLAHLIMTTPILHCQIRLILLLNIKCFIIHSSRQWKCHWCKSYCLWALCYRCFEFGPITWGYPNREGKKKKKGKRMGNGLGWVFQDNWVAKFPWVEIILGYDGKVHMVRCQVWTWIKGREKFFVPKFDNMLKNKNVGKKT